MQVGAGSRGRWRAGSPCAWPGSRLWPNASTARRKVLVRGACGGGARLRLWTANQHPLPAACLPPRSRLLLSAAPCLSPADRSIAVQRCSALSQRAARAEAVRHIPAPAGARTRHAALSHAGRAERRPFAPLVATGRHPLHGQWQCAGRVELHAGAASHSRTRLCRSHRRAPRARSALRHCTSSKSASRTSCAMRRQSQAHASACAAAAAGTMVSQPRRAAIGRACFSDSVLRQSHRRCWPTSHACTCICPTCPRHAALAR